MKKFILDNKLVSVIIATLFTSLITYGVLLGRWTVDRIYCQEEKINSHIKVQVVESDTISKQMGEVKQNVKELREEVSRSKREAGEDGVKLRKDIADNQKELLKLLIDIKRGK